MFDLSNSFHKILFKRNQMLMNKTLHERLSLRIQPFYFRGPLGLINPFDKGIFTNIKEILVSTFSNRGLGKRQDTLELITSDEERGEKNRWESVFDKRLSTDPLNWSKTFICVLFEIDCPARQEAINKIEKAKMKYKSRGNKNKYGRDSKNGIDLSESDSDDEGTGHGHCHNKKGDKVTDCDDDEDC